MTKILLTGSTGAIGGPILQRCLADPSVDSVVAYTRRAIPDDIIGSSSDEHKSKLTTVIVKDFGAPWTAEMLQAAEGADAMIWSQGLANSEVGVNHDYPIAFANTYVATLSQSSASNKKPFAFLYMSGRFVVRDQQSSVWVMSQTRKLKGKTEEATLAIAAAHPAIWRTIILRPGFVLTAAERAKRTTNVKSVLFGGLGDGMAIGADELAATAVHLAVAGVEGKEEAGVTVECEELVRRGRQLLGR